MFATILILFLVIGVFSPEAIIPVLISSVAATGLTQWLKAQTGLTAVGAMVLAIIISFVLAVSAFLGSAFLSGQPVNWATLPGAALQIFALATIAYKTLLADKN